MSVEDRIKQSAESFFKRLQFDLGSQIEEFIVELASAAEEDRAEAVGRATTALSGEAAQLKGELERVKGELERAVQQATQARAEAEKAAAGEIARLTAEVEVLKVERDSEPGAEGSVAAALSDERQAQMQSVERVLGVLRRFDQVESLSEILTALAEGAGAEAPRVALLTVRGDHVHSWRLLGFGANPPAVDLALSDAGVVARALEQGEVAFAEPAAPGHPIPAGPGFTALPADRIGLAVPLRVGGAPVAVLYADDASDAAQSKPTSWPEAIEIMVRHAALRLENLTAVRAAQALAASAPSAAAPATAAGPAPVAAGSTPPSPASASAATPVTPVATGSSEDDEGSARRYARLLVSEIKFYNEAAVRIGRQKSDLLERLHTEIDRARKLYDERVPETVPGRLAFFEEELVHTLAGGDASLLGPRTDALA